MQKLCAGLLPRCHSSELQLLPNRELIAAAPEKISSSVRTLEPHCSRKSTELFCGCTVTMALQTSAGRCESYNGSTRVLKAAV